MIIKLCIIFFLYGIFNVAYAQSYKISIICTASVRYYCAVKSGCVVNKDLNPSVYRVKSEGQNSIKLNKFINGEESTSWKARILRVDGLDRYQFVDDQILSVFSITNDRKKYTFMHNSGISLYNSDLSLNKIPDEDLGGQIETGSCIPN